jgi:hypothetical protein
MRAYGSIFGPDRWVIKAGDWKLLGINAQLLGSDSAQKAALWEWIANQVDAANDHAHTVLFLHRPMLRPRSGELARKGRYVSRAATDRLLKGPLQSTLRLVVSGHTHQYIDTTVDSVRHLWMPSTAFILPDDMQTRIGEKLVGIGLLDLGEDDARFDLWCPDGMRRHDVSTLEFFRATAESATTAQEA